MCVCVCVCVLFVNLFKPLPILLYSSQVRLDAMRHLLQFPAGDLVTCDNWPSLRTAIGDTLMDSDDTLAVRLTSRTHNDIIFIVEGGFHSED